MRNKYFIFLVLLSALWGSSFIFTRISAPALGPNLSAALRMAFASITLTGIMMGLKQSWPWQHWRELALLGFFGVAGPHVFYSWSALHLPASYGSLIGVSSVFFSAIMSNWLRVERLTEFKWMGCVLGFLGTALVLQFGPMTITHLLLLSGLACLFGSFLSGVSTPYLKKAMNHFEPLPVTAGMHIAALPMLLPGALYDLPKAHFTWPAVSAVIFMGVATSGLAYWGYLRIMRHVAPMAAQSSTFIVTGFGVLWAVLFLNEDFNSNMLIGSSLLFIASLMVMNYNPLATVIAFVIPNNTDLTSQKKPDQTKP